MGLEDEVVREEPGVEIFSLCDTFLDTDRRRIEIECRLGDLPEHDEERERAWQDLETAVTQLTGLVARLAEVKSGSLAELKVKGDILARVLQSAVADRSLLSQEGFNLALTVAQEVARLV